MTDHPRFVRPQGPAETMHQHYHGGGLVAFVLRLADLWLLRRPYAWALPRWAAADGALPVALGVRRARRRVLLTGAIMLAVVLVAALWLPARRDGSPHSLPRHPNKLALCCA
jgi:hypothetical protein